MERLFVGALLAAPASQIFEIRFSFFGFPAAPACPVYPERSDGSVVEEPLTDYLLQGRILKLAVSLANSSLLAHQNDLVEIDFPIAGRY